MTHETMTEKSAETRTFLLIARGTKLMFVLAVLLLVLAAYTFWSPLDRDVSNGFPVRCKSAANPPTDPLGKAACGNLNSNRRAQALAELVGAVVVAGGGVLVFGVRRETRARVPRTIEVP